VIATVFGLLLIPVFYVTVRRLLGDRLHHHPEPSQ
jgi:multidrug efflux pump